MIKLYENGVYLKNGTEIIEDNGLSLIHIFERIVGSV